MKPRMHPGRFFRRNPGWLLALRLLIFGGLFFGFAWHGLANGWVDITRRRCRWAPAPCDDNIYFAEHPVAFTLIVGLFIGAALFMTTASTIIYLKKKRVIRKDWKLLGMDFRF